MKLEDQVCSLELARKLKELGVLQSGAFDYYENTFHPDKPFIVLRPTVNLMEQAANWICSAFTVAELGEMLPQLLPIKKHEHHWGRLTLWRICDNWQLAYNLESKQCHEISEVDKKMADTFAKMLIHLIEAGIVNPEKGGV